MWSIFSKRMKNSKAFVAFQSREVQIFVFVWTVYHVWIPSLTGHWVSSRFYLTHFSGSIPCLFLFLPPHLPLFHFCLPPSSSSPFYFLLLHSLPEELKRQAASLEGAQAELGRVQTQLTQAQAEMENIKEVATVSESTKQEAIDQVKGQWQEEVASLQAIMKGSPATKLRLVIPIAASHVGSWLCYGLLWLKFGCCYSFPLGHR